MQIHELNNYGGALGAGSYLAVDNGNDTGKISTQRLLQSTEAEIASLEDSLNARIDNIIAGGDAPSVAEVTDARRGGNGVDYASLGAAIRGQYLDLTKDLTEYRQMRTVVENFNLYAERDYNVSGYWINASGEFVANGDSKYCIVPVCGGNDLTLWYDRTHIMASSALGGIVLQDINHTTIDVLEHADYLVSGQIYKGYGYFTIPLPSNCAFILITTKLSTLWDDTSRIIMKYGDGFQFYDGSGSTITSWDGKDFSDSETRGEVKYLESVIGGGLSKKDNIPLTISVGSFYDSNLNYTPYANNDWQTGRLDGITPYEYYFINASCAYGNMIYAFCDANDNPLKVLLDPSGSGTGTIISEVVQAPKNASYLLVGTFKGNGTLSVYTTIFSGMPFNGIKWAVFGDSLTEVNATAVTKYYNWIAERTRISVVNYGASGTGYYNSHNDGKAFYQRMANIDPDSFDFLTIFGSGNDIGQLINGFPIGTCNDYGNLLAEPTTMGAAINRTLEQYYTLCPDKPIALITPTPWQAYCQSWRMNRDNGLLMQSYCDLIKEIAYIRGIPCLNLFNESGFRPWDASFRAAYYKENGVQDGGTHPNSAGHKLLSYQFEQFIKKLI